jgi:CBS domain-containing protein
MKVGDVMSTGVLTANKDTPYKDVLERMLANGISGLPVIDGDGYVVGIVTEADLIRKLAFSGDQDRHAVLSFVSRLLTGQEAVSVLRVEGITASEIMSQPVVFVAPDDDVDHAARVMLARHVKRLPVLDDGRLVGLVARRDLMRVFHVPDSQIAAAVANSLGDPLGAPEDHQVIASVKDGVVHLTGTVLHPSDLAIVSSLVSMVGGVVAVRNDLTVRAAEPGMDNLDVPLTP